MKTPSSPRLVVSIIAMLLQPLLTSLAQPACVAPAPGIVSWWRAEGNALDEFGGNNGTLASNAVYGTGRSGQGFVFDGNGDHVALGNPASLQLQNLTIETWIKRSSNSRISYGTDGGGFLLSYGPGGYVFYLGGNARLYFAKIGDPAQSSTGTITDTNFHHVAVTKSGTTVTFYIDGVVNTVASSGSTFVFTTPVAIGAQGNNADNSFLGTIDEMAVYNRALSTNEIQGIYAAGSAGKCSTPAAPYILTQPATQTVTAGANVSFSVLAGGTPPLSYQWSINGTNLNGATTSALVLNNVQVSDSGSYAVMVSNSISTVTSSNALLTVNPLVCVNPAAGLVSWWRAESSAVDELGGNAGTLVGNAAYGPGRSGQGFVFDGTADFVSLGNPTNLQLQNFTIETWIKRASATAISHGTDGGGFLLSYGAGGYEFYLGGNAHLYFAKNGDTAVSSAGTITDTNFHHVAVTKSGTSTTFYIDGVANTVASVGSTFTFATSVVIGAQGTGGDNSFLGTIDEMAVYSRALSTNEIQGIFAAGSAGKCSAAAPPTITSHPTNQTVIVGANVTFVAAATGTPPLSYQWNFNGTNIAGATDAVLTLNAVQIGQSGNYSVLVTNVAGSATSSNAVLTVNPLQCVSPAGGLVHWWAAEGSAADSQGTLNGAPYGGTTFAPGKVGQAFSFDGVNDSVTNSAWGLTNILDSYTMELWAWPTAGRASTPERTVGTDGHGNQRYAIFPYPGPTGGTVGSGISVGTNGVSVFEHGNAYLPALLVHDVPIMDWTHIAVVYVNRQPKLYVNGVLVRTGLTSVNPSCPSTWLGERGALTANQGFYAGLLDEVSIYDRSLSAAEIQAIYTAGSAGKCVTPVPPYFTSQPTNQTVTVDADVTFAAAAAGTPPLSFQWYYNSNVLVGATEAVLTLNSVQLGQSGAYSLTVTSPFGAVTSSIAVLTVNPPQCVSPAGGLVHWWAAEGNAADSQGAIHGKLYGGTTFAAGKVGQAFSFDGVNDCVTNTTFGLTDIVDNYTMEFWASPTAGRASTSERTVGTDGHGNQRYAVFPYPGPTGGIVGSGVSVGTNGVSVFEHGNAYMPALLVYDTAINGWTHFAVVYVNRQPKLYLNGVLVRTGLTSVNPSCPSTWLGERGALTANQGFYAGLLDEVSIYNRALSAAEVQAIYTAGSAGKCVTPVAPFFVSHPVSQTVTVGADVTFTAEAAGTPPLSYQWNYNGNAIANATDGVLTLNAVQTSQAGTYAVVVTNLAGTAASSNAVLTVNFPPAAIRVIGANSTSGATVTVPITLAANGNENALGFSLNFDPAVLVYTGVSLGSGAPGASLLSNPNQTGSGRLGVAVAMPASTAFAAGTQEVVRVQFLVGVVGTNTTTLLTFGDQPVVRQLSDVPGNPLPATYTGAGVSVPATEFEGDVYPRPNGDRLLTVTDWVLVGRYVARLDHPTNAVEFQRADCAPRNNLGNGALTVSDWVQVGRYVVGLNPLTPVGGPTAENPIAPKPGVGMPSKQDGGTRKVKVVDTVLVQGQSATVSLVLEATGNENAIGASLHFDPAVLSFDGAVLGSGAAGGALNVNTNQIGLGRLGLVMALPTGTTFAAGHQEAIKLSLRAAQSAAGTYPVGFADQPVPREVADDDAVTLATSYVPGGVVINPAPVLKIARAGQSIVLTWPNWGTNFGLQECAGATLPTPAWTNIVTAPILINGENSVTLPIGEETKFYRLRGF